jgi:hypothetical protein
VSKAEHNDDCTRELAQALLRFQFIEEGIRQYLDRAYRLTQHLTKGKLAISFSVKHLKRKTLKALLTEFKKFSANDSLIKEIDRLIDKRNDLAHVAFFEMYERLLDGEDLLHVRSNALETAEQAGKCVEQLLEELHSIENLCEKEGLLVTASPPKHKQGRPSA